MRITKCDRCGAIIEPDSPPQITVVFRAYEITAPITKCEICYECYSEVLDWLKGESDGIHED